MAKRKYRRQLGQADAGTFTVSQPRFNWKNPWVIGGAVAAAGLLAWLAFGGKKDKKKAFVATPQPVPQPSTTTTAVVPPPATPQRVRVSAGDSWSKLASKHYGDWRWWPALWDANRSGGARYQDPSMLRLGDEIVIAVLPVTDGAFKAAVFDRADAYRKHLSAGGSPSSPPAAVKEYTTAPVQPAPAGSSVSPSDQPAAQQPAPEIKVVPALSPHDEISTEDELEQQKREMEAELQSRAGR